MSNMARPICHRTDHRVVAHIFVAALAFLLHRTIEKKLKAAGLDLSATEALTALKSVRVVDINLGKAASKRSVTRGTQRAAAVLRALAITDLNPPTPPATKQNRDVVPKRFVTQGTSIAYEPKCKTCASSLRA